MADFQHHSEPTAGGYFERRRRAGRDQGVWRCVPRNLSARGNRRGTFVRFDGGPVGTQADYGRDDSDVFVVLWPDLLRAIVAAGGGVAFSGGDGRGRRMGGRGEPGGGGFSGQGARARFRDFPRYERAGDLDSNAGRLGGGRKLAVCLFGGSHSRAARGLGNG